MCVCHLGWHEGPQGPCQRGPSDPLLEGHGSPLLEGHGNLPLEVRSASNVGNPFASDRCSTWRLGDHNTLHSRLIMLVNIQLLCHDLEILSFVCLFNRQYIVKSLTAHWAIINQFDNCSDSRLFIPQSTLSLSTAEEKTAT